MTDVSRGTSSTVLNPVDIEQAIRTAVNDVAEGVSVVSARLEIYRKAQREYDLAWAHAYMNAGGNMEERKQQAVISCRLLREALDVAEVSFKYAERRARAAESTLSAFQTLSKSVTAMYQGAGRGEY
jgi:hypothetical protein